MAEDYRLHQALTALQSGLRQMEEEDGEISLDIAADLPDEAAALEAAMRGVLRGIQDAEAMKVANLKQIENYHPLRPFDARQQRLRGKAARWHGCDGLAVERMARSNRDPEGRDSFGADHRRSRTPPAVRRGEGNTHPNAQGNRGGAEGRRGSAGGPHWRTVRRGFIDQRDITMNAITTSAGTSHNLVPQTMDQAVRLAEMMSKGRLLPAHLQDKPGDCLMVVEMAMRFKMSPFAVAQCTSVIQGKMMLEGKLNAAALRASGALKTRLDYVYAGEGDARAVTVSAVLTGETTPRAMTIRARDVKTSNALWTKQLDQQLAYSAARNWARRHAPEVMLGVYTPEEFDEPPPSKEPPPREPQHDGLTIDARAEPAGTREAINAAVPLSEAPKKPTWADWLDARAADFGAAQTRDAVDAVVARDDVHKAMDGALKNGGSATAQKR